MSLGGKKPGGDGDILRFAEATYATLTGCFFMFFHRKKTNRKKIQEGFDLLKDLDFEHLIPEPSQKLEPKRLANEAFFLKFYV